MPMYDYKCPACDHRFEARHSMRADAPPCPECDHTPVQRVITSAPSVAGGMLTHPGDGHRASKEQIQDKWAEETPRLRKKLESKLGRDVVRKNAPHLYNSND